MPLGQSGLGINCSAIGYSSGIFIIVTTLPHNTNTLLTTGYIWIEIKTSIQNLIKLFKKGLKYNLLYFSQSRNFSCSFFIFLLHKLLLFYIPESLQKSVSKFEKCSCTVRSAHISLSPAGLILHGCRPDIQRF